MSWVSGIEISSSQGLKKPPKISPREESLLWHISSPLFLPIFS